jgi:hypothetical protein
MAGGEITEENYSFSMSGTKFSRIESKIDPALARP